MKHYISYLAFADGLILVADTFEIAQLLTHTELYFKDMGMFIADNKCASLQVTTTRDSWYISKAAVHLAGGVRIPSSTVNDNGLPLR
jgi:hypothetical protein